MGILLVCLFVMGFIVWAVVSGNQSASPPTDHEVTYHVEGTDTRNYADVTFENEQGSTSQQNPVALPWTYTARFAAGSFLYISAQNHSNSRISVEILVDGIRRKSTWSDGQGAIAEASATL